MNAASPSPAAKARTVRCPACGGSSRYALDNAYRPFCSERCKMFDLGAWANESFRVNASPDEEDGSMPDLPQA